MFAQAELPLESRLGFVDMGRQPEQRFHGFADESEGAPAIKVDVRGFLILEDPVTHTRLPSLQVRIVKGQHDDLLVAAMYSVIRSIQKAIETRFGTLKRHELPFTWCGIVHERLAH